MVYSHDPTLIYRLFSTCGPILSVRAFEFESVYGLNLLILCVENDKLTVWITACTGKKLSCWQTCFVGTSKRRHTYRNVTEYLQRKEYSCSRREKPHATRKATPVWKLVPCSQNVSDDVEVSKKNPNLRHQEDRHEEDGVCSWAMEKIIVTAEMPDMKNISPYSWIN